MAAPPYGSLQPLDQIASPLLRWYDTVHNHRDMPWRQTRDPYAIWVSETMLQQTQVETVKPYYRRFLDRFPTIADLAAATLEEVLSLWAGLGYYRRAKHLHRAAQKCTADHGGQLPRTIAGLTALPGVGRYTAGAVGSIAFGLPAAAVDGNVMRVVARLTGYDRDIADAISRDFFWQKAEDVVAGAPAKRYGDVNQAMMELGATVCVPPPARPACLLCPVREFCRAFAEGRQRELPVKEAKKATPVVRGTAVVAIRKDQNQVLLMQRPKGGIWEGMWEFPVMGSFKKKASLQEIEERVRRELELKVAEVVECGEVRHQLTHRLMVYRVVFCAVRSKEAALPMCGDERYEAGRWVNWPLEKSQQLPLARVVHKIAALAAAESNPPLKKPAGKPVAAVIGRKRT